jgi:tRNA(fMet)-specific endonuclease VapC
MPIIGSIALDTNIAVLFLAGDSIIRRRIAEAESIAISSVVLGELFFGASQSSNLDENMRRVEDLASRFPVIDIDVETFHKTLRVN